MFIEHKQPYKSILVIRANAVSDFRMDLLYRRLLREGYDASVITQVPFYTASQYDLMVCCRPGASMLEYLKVAVMAGKQVIIDFDDDFFAIPKHNPAFGYTGAGHPTYLNTLKNVISSPEIIMTYASPELITRYRRDGIIIPNCWDEENTAWQLPKRTKPGRVTVGFSGTTTHREDFKLVEPVLKRLFAEYDNLDLVVSLDDYIYSLFLYVPEERKTYLPGVPYADYPEIYSWIDILVVPLRDTFFNRAKSDIKLVECGASHTAYVASDMPVYRDWGEGGYVAKTEQEWEQALRKLIEDAKLRTSMAEAGYQKALTRTSKLYTDKWLAVIEEVLKNENPVP